MNFKSFVGELVPVSWWIFIKDLFTAEEEEFGIEQDFGY